MNVFSKLAKLFLILFASAIFIGSVTQLQAIAFELMNRADTFDFYLGIFYLLIVIFIWGSLFYFTVDYLKNKNKKEDSSEEQDKQLTNNN